MILVIIIFVIFLLLVGFYFFVPIVDSPLTGGPVGEDGVPNKLNKVSLYRHRQLYKAINDGGHINTRNIVEWSR